MPTYDYVCEKCGKQFEVFQSMNDDRLEACLDEACDGRMKRKIGTGAGVIFKGSGFYTTDYRSESYRAGASKERGASGGDGSGGGEKGSSGGKEGGGAASASGSGESSGGGRSTGGGGESSSSKSD